MSPVFIYCFYCIYGVRVCWWWCCCCCWVHVFIDYYYCWLSYRIVERYRDSRNFYSTTRANFNDQERRVKIRKGYDMQERKKSNGKIIIFNISNFHPPFLNIMHTYECTHTHIFAFAYHRQTYIPSCIYLIWNQNHLPRSF